MHRYWLWRKIHNVYLRLTTDTLLIWEITPYMPKLSITIALKILKLKLLPWLPWLIVVQLFHCLFLTKIYLYWLVWWFSWFWWLPGLLSCLRIHYCHLLDDIRVISAYSVNFSSSANNSGCYNNTWILAGSLKPSVYINNYAPSSRALLPSSNTTP